MPWYVCTQRPRDSVETGGAVAGARAKPAGQSAAEPTSCGSIMRLLDRLGAQQAGRVIRENGTQVHSDLLGALRLGWLTVELTAVRLLPP